jgi:hypothetical protein
MATALGCMGFTFNMGMFFKGAATPTCDPNDTPNLQLFLDASDTSNLYQGAGEISPVTADGHLVQRWYNKVDTSQYCEQTTSGDRPVYRASAINGRSALEFDVSKYCATAQTAGNFFDPDNFTTFVVSKPDSTSIVLRVGSGSSLALSMGNVNGSAYWLNSNGGTYFGAPAGGHVAISQMKQGSPDYFYNGKSTALSGFVGGGTLGGMGDPVYVGADLGGVSYFDGMIGAVLIYDRALTTTEITDVGSCLMSKFGF